MSWYLLPSEMRMRVENGARDKDREREREMLMQRGMVGLEKHPPFEMNA